MNAAAPLQSCAPHSFGACAHVVCDVQLKQRKGKRDKKRGGGRNELCRIVGYFSL